MASKAYFRDHCVDDTSFFDEGPDKRPNSNLIDGTATDVVDQFRQGVEITRPEYYGAGIVKIHAGNPGHKLRQTDFGADTKYITPNSYVDYDNFDPVTYVKAGGNASYLPQKTIVSYNEQVSDEYIYNGVLEPFTIRSRFSKSPYHPTRKANGAPMIGNERLGGSDEIQTIYVNDVARSTYAFSDVYVIQTYVTSSQPRVISASTILRNLTVISSAPTPDQIVSTGLSRSRPFNDIKLQRENLDSLSYGVIMDAALRLLDPSQDNYVNTSLSEKSANCGWTYEDSTQVGTDSIAFGGMTF